MQLTYLNVVARCDRDLIFAWVGGRIYRLYGGGFTRSVGVESAKVEI